MKTQSAPKIVTSEPVVFQSQFNEFENINATNAWSLFFSGGKSEDAVGIGPTFGRLLTLITVAFVAVGIVTAV